MPTGDDDIASSQLNRQVRPATREIIPAFLKIKNEENFNMNDREVFEANSMYILFLCINKSKFRNRLFEIIIRF